MKNLLCMSPSPVWSQATSHLRTSLDIWHSTMSTLYMPSYLAYKACPYHFQIRAWKHFNADNLCTDMRQFRLTLTSWRPQPGGMPPNRHPATFPIHIASYSCQIGYSLPATAITKWTFHPSPALASTFRFLILPSLSSTSNTTLLLQLPLH
jgi:hypothetical protein